MRRAFLVLLLAVLAGVLFGTTAASAQQVTVGTPFNSLGDSFFEHFGTNWSFNWRGINATFGRPNMAAPGFGRFDPNAGINSGFFVGGNGFNGSLSFSYGQGYRQSFISQTPSVTLTNGYPGRISNSTQRPFVIGFVPVVGGAPTVGGFPTIRPGNPMSSPGSLPEAPRNDRVQRFIQQLAEKQRAEAEGRCPQPDAAPARKPALPPKVIDHSAGDGGRTKRPAAAGSSSAARAAPSVSKARRLFQQEQATRENRAKDLLRRGLEAERAGRSRTAKAYYQMVLREATGETKARAQSRLDALSSPGG